MATKTAARKTAAPKKTAPPKRAAAKKTVAPRERQVKSEQAEVAEEVKATEQPKPAKRARKAAKAAAPAEPATTEEVDKLVAEANEAVASAREARGVKRGGGRKAPAPRKPEPEAPKPKPKPEPAQEGPRSYVIRDVEQAAQWIKEGKTYIEMADLHEQLYPGTRRVAPATFSLLRQRLGLPARHVRGHSNVPWPLSADNKHSRVATLLRSFERIQRSMEVSTDRQKMVYAWLQRNKLAQFTEDGFMLPLKDNPGPKVVDYDHTSGFTYVPRRKSDDPALIVRKPTKARVDELRAALA